MYLEKLEILGFKSFGKRTSFSFNNGITSIVGPNGCGKSNIVDAIRWVLGEQKAGILRSERMENVIFSGTKTLKPLGMAEVSLTIKNTKNILPVEYTDVVITRRLFRSGESHYLLNNTSCRLKDIIDLFMDTGMGPDAYSVIELRMVESILDGKPEERRRILEQAAGVSKYKMRRRSAYKKLDDTEKDLVRIEDIISEVQKNVDSLKRQVRKARRHQELSEQLKTAEIRYETIRYSALLDELDPSQTNHTLISRDLNKLSAKMHLHESDIETLQTRLIQIEQKLSTAQEKLDSANKAIYKKEEEITICRERLNATEERNRRNEIDKKEFEERLTHLQQRKDDSIEVMARLQKEITAIEKQYATHKAVLAELEKSQEQKQTALRNNEKQHLQLLDAVSTKSNENERLQYQLEHQAKRLDELVSEKSFLKKQTADNENIFHTFEDKISMIVDDLDRKIIERNETEEKISSMLDEAEKLKETIFSDKNRVADINNKIQLLKQLIESYEDFPEGVRNLMRNKKDGGFPGTVADVISVPEKYRVAFESFLGEASAFVISNDISLAFNAIEYLKKNGKGIATCLPVENFPHSQPETSQANDLTGVRGFIGFGHELVKCESHFRPIVDLLLKNCIIVEDIALIREKANQVLNSGFNLVSLTGEIIYGWGAIKGGQKPGKNESPIGRKDQLDHIESDKYELLDSIEKNEKTRERMLQEIDRLSLNRKRSAEHIKELERQKADVQLELRQKRFEHDKYSEQLNKNSSEMSSIKEEIQAVRQQLVSMEPEIKQAEARKKQLQSDIETVQNELEILNKKTNSAAEEVHSLNLKVVEKKGEFTNAEQEQARNALLAKEYTHSIETRQQEIVEGIKKKEQLRKRIAELNDELETDFNMQDELERIVQRYEAERGEITRQLDKINQVMKGLRFDREQISEKIHGLELKISEIKLRADNIQQMVKEEYEIQLKREKVCEADATENLKHEIETTKSKLRALGPINLLALKEYDKEKERLDFLTAQETDLINARKNLVDTIEVINRTAQTKFLEVYSVVRKNFSQVFKGFFPEGEADLVMAQSSDVLEADIEIIANAKGLKLGSLALLSGGEKTLTATSLLFAIYLVKPSPFCILDEVDAPLDDTNIERFTSAIRKFSDNTQFIIVTHNKLTMKSADCLYGITMPQDGVSKVVSVKMESD